MDKPAGTSTGPYCNLLEIRFPELYVATVDQTEDYIAELKSQIPQDAWTSLPSEPGQWHQYSLSKSDEFLASSVIWEKRTFIDPSHGDTSYMIRYHQNMEEANAYAIAIHDSHWFHNGPDENGIFRQEGDNFDFYFTKPRAPFSLCDIHQDENGIFTLRQIRPCKIHSGPLLIYFAERDDESWHHIVDHTGAKVDGSLFGMTLQPTLN